MASVINTNMASLYAQKNLTGAQSALATSVERLSSGLRINRAKDDAAGLGISETIKTQVTALNQGVRNANDAISMVQAAEGSLNEVSNLLQRMKELSVQARNEALSTVQRAYISNEIMDLKSEINAIAERTTFNDMSLLKNAIRTQVGGAGAGQIAEGAEILDGVTISNITLKNTNAGTYTFSTQTRTTIGSYGTSSVDDAAGSTGQYTETGTISGTVDTPASGYDASTRTIDLNNLEAALVNDSQLTLSENTRVVVTINGVDYSVVVGSIDATSEGQVAAALETVLEDFYPDTSSSNVTGIVTLASTAGVGLADISIRAETLKQGDEVQNISSYVSVPGTADTSTRTITLKDQDIVEGRKVTVTIGNPDNYLEYSVYVGKGDTATTIAAQLETLIDDQFTDSAAASGVITLESTANMGMGNISLKFYDTEVDQVVYREVDDAGQDNNRAAYDVIQGKRGAEDARTITLSEDDLITGRTISVLINGKEYATKVEAQDTMANVAYKLAGAINEDYRYTNPSTEVVTQWATNTVGTGVITLTSQAELGLASIELQVSSVSNAGQLKLVADANTGLSGAASELSVGSIANGASKRFNFDQLGVSFDITNTSGQELTSEDFETLASRVSQLTVSATMDGDALFQIGADTRDTVVVNGFKDIRISQYNQNAGIENSKFEDLDTILTTISANTEATLTEGNFEILESRIDDVIELVAGFRGDLGAQQNRIEFAISNIQALAENLTEANSRIRDTDYAAETANLTKTQIMQQAATAMLAQANQMPNVILALLK